MTQPNKSIEDAIDKITLESFDDGTIQVYPEAIKQLVQQLKEETAWNFEKEYHKAHADGVEEERERILKDVEGIVKNSFQSEVVSNIYSYLDPLSNPPKT